MIPILLSLLECDCFERPNLSETNRPRSMLQGSTIMTRVSEPPYSGVLEIATPAKNRKATVRKLGSTILAAFGVALALNVAVCFLPENTYQRWKDIDSDYGRMGWMYERIHYDPRPIDVVILGSSRSQLGFSPSSIEQQLAEHGKPANVVNFAIFNVGRNLQWLILGEIYKVKSPKVIVLEVDDPPYPLGHELFKEAAPAGAIVSAPKRAFHEYFDDLVYLPARKLRLFGANLFPELFGLTKQFDPAAYERNRTDFTTNFTDETGGIVKMDGAVPRAVLLERASQQTSRNAWIAGQYARLNGGADRVYIGKIADEAKAHGAQLVFAYMPSFNGAEKASALDFAKQYGAVIDNGDLAPRDELFENWSHLNHAGAMIASARLADTIEHLRERVSLPETQPAADRAPHAL
jgi:hypothetical protein